MSNKQKRIDLDDGERKKKKIEEDSDEEQRQSIVEWFVKQQRIPVAFNTEEDGFAPDATCRDTSLVVKMHEDRDDRRNQLGRQLWSFDNDAVVIKHCAPWAEGAMLCNRFYIVVKKFFSSSGQPRYILIRQSSAPYNEYVLDEPFFAGWSTIDDHLDINYDYLARG
jgi:hypothetical protein